MRPATGRRRYLSRISEFCRGQDFLKLIKIVIIICCVGGFFYQLSAFMHLYLSYPTAVDLTIDKPKSVELPAVTVCDKNGILVTKFCEKFKGNCRKHKKTEYAIPYVTHQEIPDMTRKEYKDLGPQPILQYRIQNTTGRTVNDGINHNGTKKATGTWGMQWVGVVDNELIPNTCYAVNSLWGNVTGKPRKIPRTSNLFFWLTTQESQYFYPGILHVGFQLAIHDPRSLVNPLTEGFSLQAGRAYYVYVKQTVHQLLQAPYTTNCFDYQEMWRARGGKGPLSSQQCTEECLKNMTIERYGCNRDFVSFEENDTFCHIILPGYEEDDMASCLNQCPPACKSVEYHVEIEEQGPSFGNSRDTKSVQIWMFFTRMESMTFTYIPKFQCVDVVTYAGSCTAFWLAVCLLVKLVGMIGTECKSTWTKLTRILRREGRRTSAAEMTTTMEESKQNSKSGAVQLGGLLYWNMVGSIAGLPIKRQQDDLYSMEKVIDPLKDIAENKSRKSIYIYKKGEK